MQKRNHYLFVVLFCLAMFSTALFFQLVVGLEPCPLCVFQRIALLFIGLVGLLAFLHNPRGFADRLYGVLLIVGGLGSLGVAVRHVWLLSLPKDEAASCGPGMEIWLDRFIAVLRSMASVADCALALPPASMSKSIRAGRSIFVLFLESNKR